ncbi:hypothetical protein [Glutamicibacter creatinolyticus]|uniref:deoxynucleotide monophosphate kinase family protein n=1 Tax=Glutamicibacter creatinolyticus TaxID=162496 RepID=UPI003216F25C
MAGNIIIIGLTGYKQHGKSTVASQLEQEHGFTRLSFAGPLKEMADRINPVVGINAYLDGDEFIAEPIHLDAARASCADENDLKSRYPLYRLFLQRLGTEGLRKVDDSFWLKLMDETIGDLVQRGQRRFVIDDARFPNESELIGSYRNFGMVSALWQVTRPGAGIPNDPHPSEAFVGQLGEARHLKNSGTVEELNDLVDAVVAPYIEEAEGN